MTNNCEFCGHFYAYTGKELCKVTDPEEKDFHAFTQKGWGLCTRFKDTALANEKAFKERNEEIDEELKGEIEKAKKLKLPIYKNMGCIDFKEVKA